MSLLMELKCELCEHDFDLPNRCPKTLHVCCGKVVCQECVKNCFLENGLFVCPFEGKEMLLADAKDTLFPDDSSRVEILKQKQFKRCKKHANDPRNVQTKCRGCQTLNESKTSSKKSPSPRKEAEEHKHLLNQSVKDLDRQYQVMDEGLEGNLAKLLKISSDKFKQIRRELNNQEFEFSEKLRDLVSTQKAKLNSTLGADSSIQKSIVQSLGSEVTPQVMIHKKIDFLLSPNIMTEYAQIFQRFGTVYQTLFEEKFKQFPKFSELLSTSQLSQDLDQVFLNRYNNEDEWVETNTNTNLISEESPDLSSMNAELKIKARDGSLHISAKRETVKMEESQALEFDLQVLKSATKAFSKVEGHLLSNQKVNAFSSAWNLLDSVLYFHIDFKGGVSSALTDLQLNVVPINKLKRRELQGITVNLNDCYQVSDDSIHLFLKALLNNKVLLKALNLGLNSTKISEKTLALLSNYIPTLTHLEELKLSLKKTAISDSMILSLFKKMEKIKKLELILYHTNVTDRTLTDFAKNTLSNMRALQDLKLDFSSPKSSSLTGDGIAQIFIPIPNLKQLSLNFGKIFTFKNEHLQILVDRMLANLKGLAVLEIDLQETQVTDQGVAKLMLFLKELKGLRALNLNLAKLPKIMNGTVLNDKRTFLSNLKKFQLNLEDTGVSDQVIQGIFGNMPKIENFELTLNQNSKISDLSLDFFTTEALTSMKSSASLKLGLASTKVTDESVSKFFLNLKNYSNFTNLHFDFKNTIITDKSATVLLEKVLTNLKNLKTFVIEVNGSKISQELQQKLSEFQNKLFK